METEASRKETRKLWRSRTKKNVLSKQQARFQPVLAPQKAQLSKIFDDESQFTKNIFLQKTFIYHCQYIQNA